MAKGRSTWGSIRKRGKESWEIRYPFGTKNRSETIRGTRSDAERRLAELRIEYEGISGDITVSQFWDNPYLPEITEELAPSTVEGYTNKYENYILPHFGDDIMREIKPAKIQPWLLEMTYETAKHAKVVLSSMFSRAVIHGVVDENVAALRYQLPKKKGKPCNRNVFSEDELSAVLEACRGEIFEAALILAGGGGALRGEACSPKVNEIVFIEDFAIVPIVRSVQRIGGEVIVVEDTKTEEREADLIVVPPFADRLKELVGEATERGDEWLSDDGFKNPIDPEIISKTYERWFQTQPFVYVPFRNLRNSYSTILHKLMLEDSLISKLMRHANLTTDYKHYNRLSTDEKIRMLRKAMGNIAHNCP